MTCATCPLRLATPATLGRNLEAAPKGARRSWRSDRWYLTDAVVAEQNVMGQVRPTLRRSRTSRKSTERQRRSWPPTWRGFPGRGPSVGPSDQTRIDYAPRFHALRRLTSASYAASMPGAPVRASVSAALMALGSSPFSRRPPRAFHRRLALITAKTARGHCPRPANLILAPRPKGAAGKKPASTFLRLVKRAAVAASFATETSYETWR